MNIHSWPSGEASRATTSGQVVAELARIASLVVIGAALGWHSIEAPATERTVPLAAPEAWTTKVRLAELEKTFWLCDYAATSHGVDPELGILCFNATEELKQQKFGGDGEKLLAWWQRNKAAQHKKFEQAEAME